MADVKVVPCRLCLNVIISEDMEALGVHERNILQMLIPNLNLDVTADPKICRSCNKTMVTSYQFAVRCKEEFYRNDAKVGGVMLEKPDEVSKKCYFCTNTVDSVALREFKINKVYFHQILKMCMPAWDPVKHKELIPCSNCLKALKKQFAFINICQGTEEKIDKYISKKGVNSREKINLYEVIQPNVRTRSPRVLPVEKQEYENQLCNLDLKINPEDIKIEHHKVDFTQASVSGFSLVIKQEDDGEDSTNFFLKTEDVDIKTEEEEEYVEQPCSSNVQADPLTLRTQGSPSQDQILQYTDGENIFLESSDAIETTIEVPDRRKRPSTSQDGPTTSKQQKLKVRQDLRTGDAPNKRSIGIQVNPGDLIKRCSIGIQVVPWDVDSRSVAVDAKPDADDKEVTCKPAVLHTATTTKGAVTKEKRGAFRPRILRKSKK